MRKLLLLAFIPALAFGQVLSRPGLPASGGTFTGAVTAPAFDPPAQDFLFYANPATGSDANACTSSATPCATFAGAVGKLPRTWRQKCRIILAAGAYTVGNLNIQAGIPYPGTGEPLVIQGAMVDSGLGELTVTAAGATSAGNVYQLTAAVAPTLDQYRGYFLRMTTCAAGAGCVGLQRIVRSNTVGGLFEMNNPDPGAGYRPAVGDKFVVERPCSVITYSGAVQFNGPGSQTTAGGSIVLDQLRFVRASGSITFSSGTTYVNTVEIEMGASTTGIMVGDGGTLQAGQYLTAAQTPMTDLLADPAAKKWGSGLVTTSTSGGFRFGVLENSILKGFLVMTGHNLASYGESYMFLSAPSLRTGYIDIDGHSDATIDSSYCEAGQVSGSSISGIRVRSNGFIYITNCGVDSSSNGEDGLRVEQGGVVRMQGIITGTGNTGAGVGVQTGGIYLEQATGSTVTGTAGEIRVGNQTTTHAAVFGGTPLIDVVGGMANNTATAATALTLPAVTTPSVTTSATTGNNALMLVSGSKACFDSATCAAAMSYNGTSIISTKQLSAPSLVTTGATGTVVMSGATGSKFCPGSSTNGCFTSANSVGITADKTINGPYVNVKIISAINDAAENSFALGDKTTLDSCDQYSEGYFQRQGGAASSSVGTKVCFCRSDGAASPAYAWKNITGVFASDAASIGTSTTCP